MRLVFHESQHFAKSTKPVIGSGNAFRRNPFGFMFYGNFQAGILCIKYNFEDVCRGRGGAPSTSENFLQPGT